MISQKVLELLRKVPKGKVTTYKTLAEKAGTSPRAVGQIMRRNRRPDCYPCYKVVKADGSLGGYSGPGGLREKVRRLEKEGIRVRDRRIDKERIHYF